MSTLFTVNKSWYDTAWLYEQRVFASEGDVVLLMQDAVLGLNSRVALASFLAKCKAARIAVYAVRDDLKMRGIDNQYPQVELLDYEGFVELLIKANKQVAW